MKEVHFPEGRSVATQGRRGVGFHLVVDGTRRRSVKDGVPRHADRATAATSARSA